MGRKEGQRREEARSRSQEYYRNGLAGLYSSRELPSVLEFLAGSMGKMDRMVVIATALDRVARFATLFTDGETLSNFGMKEPKEVYDLFLDRTAEVMASSQLQLPNRPSEEELRRLAELSREYSKTFRGISDLYSIFPPIPLDRLPK